ncbi:MAG: GDSL-type esterase/lipase family protein [Chthoniobacteraceae bacterium]
MKPLALLFSLFVAFSFVHAAEEYEARTFTNPDGKTLPYRLLIPKNYDPAQKYPLVLFLHGAGERGTDNVAQLTHGAPLFLKPEVRDQFPCFVLAPQCPPEQQWSAVKGWNGPVAYAEEPTEPMALALGAVDAVEKEFSIDPDRLYVTGLSMGGYGSWDAVCRNPQKWAAAAPVCGGGEPARIAAAKDVPVWAFHGLNDNVVPLERSEEMVRALKEAGGTAMLSVYPYTGHDSWTIAYGEPQILPWMFAQKRGAKTVSFQEVAGDLAQPPSSEFPGAGTIQNGLWFRQLWAERRGEWVRGKLTDQNAVVFFGDSITQGWNNLAQDFLKLKVANRGISGDTTRGLRYRMQDDVIALHPRAVSILIGTNDLDQGTPPEVVVENLKAIVAALHNADPAMPIIINKVMPRGAQSNKFPELIMKLNGLYEQTFANDDKITFCDTWSIFDDGSGQPKKDEFPDMLHPNGVGYAKWVEALKPVLQKAGVE